jgi:hypothetical protein
MRVPPVDLEPEWVSELRRFKIRDNTGQKGDLVAYFDLMTRHLTMHPNEHVSKYGLQRFKQFDPRPTNVPLLQSMLCHIGVAEPGSIREVVEALLFLRTGGHQLDARIIRESLSAVLRNSTPLGHHYEAAWALFGIIQFGIVLNRPTVVALSSTENSVVAILALDALAKGLAPRLNTAAWALRMKASDLREDEWLPSYEANVQGWLGTVGGEDHVANDPEFGFLKASGVRFYIP